MIKKFELTKTERRVVIILMIINSFALFVNKYEFQGRINNCHYIITNSGENYVKEKDLFYPFFKFNDRNDCFQGIFQYYDSSEFYIYTLLIFGVLFIKKVW